MTLTDFLLARIADDEERARFVWGQVDEYDLLCIEPDRAIAECEAKRRIVEAYNGPLTVSDDCYFDGLEVAVRHLAAVYADHPDYREEWKP